MVFDKNREKIHHGYSRTNLYKRLDQIKHRCYDPNHKHYHNYGGRGISVCEEWLQSPANFIEWALVNGYEKHLSIDRIDNDKGYGPDNCRWTDKKTQQRNRRGNFVIEAFGMRKCASEWVLDNRCSIRQNTLVRRISILKWPPEKAICEPNMALAEYRGAHVPIRKLAQLPECKVGYKALYHRIVDLGWDATTAINSPHQEDGKETYSAFGEVKNLLEWSKDERCCVSYMALHRRINTLKWGMFDALVTKPYQKIAS